MLFKMEMKRDWLIVLLRNNNKSSIIHFAKFDVDLADKYGNTNTVQCDLESNFNWLCIVLKPCFSINLAEQFNILFSSQKFQISQIIFQLNMPFFFSISHFCVKNNLLTLILKPPIFPSACMH